MILHVAILERVKHLADFCRREAAKAKRQATDSSLPEIQTLNKDLAWEHDRNAEALDLLLAERERMLDTLALIDAAFLNRHGCFPLDRATDSQRLWNSAMTAVREITGDDFVQRGDRAAKVLKARGVGPITVFPFTGLVFKETVARPEARES